jgi:hypothetical protein
MVLAQDLIWQTRLASQVAAAGGRPVTARSLADLDRNLRDRDADGLIVDLTARAYDPIAAIERATTVGVRVLAVGQHDDHPLRKRALAAGAERVLAYRKLHEDGPATIGGWLEGAPQRTAAG